MILMIDNYDSFTYNLYQLIGTINPDIKVFRNDSITIDEIRKLNPTHIIISPGPKYPSEAGISEDVARELKGEYPILGICLGHQAICEVNGANICHAIKLIHGKKTPVKLDLSCKLFKGLPEVVEVARYHSLIAEKKSLPDTLQVISEDLQGEIMGVKVKGFEIYGLQFHPESILTSCGDTILRNFLNIHL